MSRYGSDDPFFRKLDRKVREAHMERISGHKVSEDPFDDALDLFQDWAIAFGQLPEDKALDAQKEMHKARKALRALYDAAGEGE